MVGIPDQVAMSAIDRALVPLEQLVPAFPDVPAQLPAELITWLTQLWWNSLAQNTWKGYRSSWRVYQRWCASFDLPALPLDPWTIALFLSAHAATHKPGTLQRWLAALEQVQTLTRGEGEIVTETVRRVLRGAKRLYGKPPIRKAALMHAMLRQILEITDAQRSRYGAARDAALFCLMFYGALRRSDARNRNVGDVQFAGDGLLLEVESSKTDPLHHGRRIPISATPDPLTDPVRRIRELLEILPADGPLFRGLLRGGRGFRSGRLSLSGIDNLFKKYIAQVSSHPRDYGPHSARAGFVTEAKLAGLEDAVIMLVTLHASPESLYDYVRVESALKLGISARIGL